MTGGPGWFDETGFATSGNVLAFGVNSDQVTDARLTMKSPVTIPTDGFLHLAHAYDLEAGFDGGVIEYRAGGGPWRDITSGGPTFTHLGYNDTVNGGFGNPLSGRNAFSGTSNGYRSLRVDLGSLAGQDVRFRFRLGNDSSTGWFGWFLDDLRIYSCGPASPSVAVAKRADQTEVGAGMDVDLHIDITNTGNVPLTGVAVTDAAAPDCAGPVDDVAPGTTTTVDCRYTTIDPGDIGIYSNTAQVATNEVPGPTATNQVDVTVSDCNGHGFGDVPPWVTDAVDWAWCTTYMSGYPDNTFRPDESITRAQVARLLYRVSGSPDVSSLPGHGFSDVPGWVNDAVTWLAYNNFATGYPDDTFRPNLPITRAQVTRMLYRVEASPTGAPQHGFTDVPAWVETAVNWITDAGYATGYPDNTYRPNIDITRAQTTRMVCRINTTPGTC